MAFFLRYKWHFLFWAAYFVFWTAVSVRGYHTPLFLALMVTLGWAIGQGVLNYFCIYRLFPVYFNSRRYRLFSSILLATLLVSTLFVLGFQLVVYKLEGDPLPYSVGAGFGYILLGNVYTVFLVIAIKSIRDKVLNDRRTQLLEKEKTEHELHFLRSQMNPHFLFNAINSIYVLIRKDPDIASHTLLKFADMLRYQLYECNADRISIEKEIVYLDNYVGLERLRKGDALCVKYYVGEEVKFFSIAPLLIIPFVENAFKYVSSYPDRPNEVAINLRCREGQFELQVRNTTDVETFGRGEGARVKVPGGGIGLENVRRRLELIYNGRHQLEVRRGENDYYVMLKIPVQ